MPLFVASLSSHFWDDLLTPKENEIYIRERERGAKTASVKKIDLCF